MTRTFSRDENNRYPDSETVHNINMTVAAQLLQKRRLKVELQWLEHLWNSENIYETGVVRVHSARSGGIIGIFFSIFFNMKVCCVFSLESPHRGYSNEYKNIPLSI